jgi:two-component system, NarL family, response regulator
MKEKSKPAPSQATIRLLVADDHPVVRQGIIANVTLQPDMTIVAEANDGLEAITLIKEHLPDVVLLDLRMPRMDGLDVAAEVQAARLPSKVIIMTTFDSEDDVRRSMKAGVRGYLLKDSSREEILEAIRQVNIGKTYLPARIVQRVAEGMRKPELSRRELEVLQDVAAGKSNKEIGVRLFIAEGTVKTHVKSLLEKLDAASRTAAVKEATHRGFVRYN